MRITIAVLVLFICLFVGNGYVYADEYTYDENGRVIEIIHDDGTVTTYTYDDNGNILSVSTVASDSNLNIEEPTTKTELTTEENPTTTEEQITDSKPTTENTTGDNGKTDDNGSKNDVNNNQSSRNNASTQSDTNKTGDESLLFIIIFCLIISGCISSGLMIKKYNN